MKVGDLVVNTYTGAVMKGIPGLVVHINRWGDVTVMYENESQRVTEACLEVISENR